MSEENNSVACSCCGCLLLLMFLPVIVILFRYALKIGLIALGIGVVLFIILLGLGAVGLILDKLGFIKLDKEGNSQNNEQNYSSGSTGSSSQLFYNKLFQALGSLAQVDGTVSNSEINFFHDFIDGINLSQRDKEIALSEFKNGYQSSMSYQSHINKVKTSANGDHTLLQMALSFFCMMAMADGEFSPLEQQFINYAETQFELLGFSETFFSQNKNQKKYDDKSYSHRQNSNRNTNNRNNNSNQNSNRNSNRSQSRRSTTSSLSTYYAILEVSENATNAEIKKAYRKKSMEFHPDKIASKGLPDAFKKFAEEEQKKINKAYQEIKKARNM